MHIYACVCMSVTNANTCDIHACVVMKCDGIRILFCFKARKMKECIEWMAITMFHISGMTCAELCQMILS